HVATPRALHQTCASCRRKRSLHCSATLRPSDLHAVFIRRRFGKLMLRSCSGKPQRKSVANRATSILGWGPYHAVWGSSCRLEKLSRSGWCGDQRGLCRVAGHHAASPRPVADDGPHLPAAEASSASLRRCRRGERRWRMMKLAAALCTRGLRAEAKDVLRRAIALAPHAATP